MRKTIRHARTSALPAVAAALALSSTHAFAQEAAPQPQPPPTASEPAPVSVDPAPAPETSPATIEKVTPATPVVTSAPEPKATARPKRTATAVKAATPAPRPAPTRAATRPAPAAVPTAVPTAPTPNEAPSLSAVEPIVDTTAAPAQPAAPAKPAGSDNRVAMELGGGALALLALGAGAYALARRRRREDEVMYEETYESETVAGAEPAPMAQAAPAPRRDPIFDEQPAIVTPAPSAFSWGNEQPCDQPSDDGSDRCPGETWVERAYRGPSPANPSVSLRNRLGRAAFFDKREREVAAGTAEPVETDAGLPEAMVEEQERELA